MAFFTWAPPSRGPGGGGSGEANTISSLGTGQAIAAGKNGVDLQLKSLKAGANVTLSADANEITIASSGGGGGGSGEANTTSSLGTGEQITAPKNGADLPFKSLKAGANVTLTADANEVTIAASGGSTPPTTDAADLTTGELADARVAESNVTQHQAALQLTESQITDLKAYGLASAVTANATAIADKADQSALATTNANVGTNTTAIAAKADQTALDATNTNVSANATAIASKAEQSALGTTNANVAANTAAIADKADQSALATTDINVAANATAIAAKADQTALDTTNANVGTNTTAIATKATPPGLAVDADSGANHSFDLSASRTHKLTLTANCTLSFSGQVDGESYTIVLVQDATGGRTVTWPSSVKWEGGSPPTLATPAASVDMVVLRFDGSDFLAEAVTTYASGGGGGGGPTTQKSGTIAASETWSGTIQITADLQIADAATVTIQPGTVVEFMGEFWIEVIGDMQAVGNVSNRIAFRPASGVANWYGIIFGANVDGFTWGEAKKGVNPSFQFCDFTDSSKLGRNTVGDRHHQRGGAIGYNQGDAITIEDCTFTRCKAIQQGGGVYINGGSLNKNYAIRRCTFTDCQGDYAAAWKVDHGNVHTIESCTYSGAVTSRADFTDFAVAVDSAQDGFQAPSNQFMKTASPVKFVEGTMPGGIVQGQDYFAIPITDTQFRVADSIANANAGTFVALSSNGANVKCTTNYDWLVFDASVNIT